MLGISTIVEVLLITLLLISLVSLLWFFTSGTVNAITKSGTNQTQRTQEIFSTCMIVDSIYGNKVYLKNCEYGVITNDSLNVYLNDVPLKFNMTPQKIGKGEVGTITILNDPAEFAIGDYDLKITNPNAQTVQSAKYVLPDSCVLDLEFDEGKGRSTHDRSGNENNGVLLSINGTLYGDAHWVPGRFDGYGIQFDGNGDDYARIESLPGLWPNPGNGPVSITLWFKTSVTNPSGTEYLFSDSWNEIGFYYINTGYIEAIVCWGALPSLQPITANEWHFLALSYDNTTVSFYLDGIFQGSRAMSTSGCNYGYNDPPFRIGIDSQGNGLTGAFNGVIDDVRVWNRGLSQPEIQAEMQSSSPVTNPIWSFEPSWMWVNGKFGKALFFGNTNNDAVTINPVTNFPTSAITTEFWIKDADSGDGIISYAATSPDNEWLLYDSSNLNICEGGNCVVTGIPINDNNWHFVVVTWNGPDGQTKMYKDGVLVFTGTLSAGRSITGGGSLMLGQEQDCVGGCLDSSQALQGTLDEVRIFNQALTPDQIDHVMLKMK